MILLRSASVLCIVGTLIVLSGCGGEKAPDGRLVLVVAGDEGQDIPDTLLAGVNHVVFENRGSTIHEMMFIKLPEGMSGADYVAQVESGIDFPPGAEDCSGPGLTSPGRTSEVWLDLDPGTYVLACWFRSHLTREAIRTITVVESSTPSATPPPEDAVLRLVDYRFEVGGLMQAGPRVFRIEMVGPSMHEVDLFRLEEGKTLADLTAWQRNHQEGPPPATAMGGAMDSHHINRVLWLRTELLPGRYVLWCGMPMTQDASGAAGEGSHADAGMVQEFTVQ